MQKKINYFERRRSNNQNARHVNRVKKIKKNIVIRNGTT